MSHNVSTCIFSIIAAYTSGFDVVRKIRLQRGKRKGALYTTRTEEEIALIRSLRRGPVDIRSRYEKSVDEFGDLVVIGDVPAQASLTETLLKLNTGLVGIISSFLAENDGVKSGLDYPGLTSLSDRSRVEAVNALTQLCHRISCAEIARLQAPYHRDSSTRQESYRALGKAPERPEQASIRTQSIESERARRLQSIDSEGTRLPQGVNEAPYRKSLEGASAARVNVANTQQAHLVRVRSRSRTTASSSSATPSPQPTLQSSEKVTSTASTTPHTSPSPTPPIDGLSTSFPPSPPLSTKVREQNAIRRFVQQTQNQWPLPSIPTSIPALPAEARTEYFGASQQTLTSAPPRRVEGRTEYFGASHQTLTSAPPPRRVEDRKPSTPTPTTPHADTISVHSAPPERPGPQRSNNSFYSLATSSSKFGAVPARKWTPQYDAATMEQLNREVQAQADGRSSRGSAASMPRRDGARGRLLRMITGC